MTFIKTIVESTLKLGKVHEKKYVKATRTAFKIHVILGYFYCISCYNFCIIFTRVASFHVFTKFTKKSKIMIY